MSSLRHVDSSLSGDYSRPGNSSCVERIGGGRDTHLYKTSRFSLDRLGNQVSEVRFGEWNHQGKHLCRLFARVPLGGVLHPLLWDDAGNGLGFWWNGVGWISLVWTASPSNELRPSMSLWGQTFGDGLVVGWTSFWRGSLFSTEPMTSVPRLGGPIEADVGVTWPSVTTIGDPPLVVVGVKSFF